MDAALTPIQRACQLAGGQAALARILGLTPAVINQWVSERRPIPVERCFAIERATHGAVTRKDLRPADWQDIWPELAEAAVAMLPPGNRKAA